MVRLITLFLTICLFNSAHADHGNGILLHQKKTSQSVGLTDKEKSWLSNHKTIRIAFDGSLPPYSFINESGRFEGIAVDIINLLSKELGVKFKTYPNSNWENIYKAAAMHKIDVVATMVDRPERRLWFNFTQPYLTKSLVIMTRKDNTAIKNRSDLADKKVALPRGYHYGDQVKNEFPTIKPYFVNSLLQGLKAVSENKADAAITFMATANYFQLKNQINNIVFVDFYDRNSADESIAVRKDWAMLAGILQKGLDSLHEAEINAIFTKWVTSTPPESAAALKTDENKVSIGKNAESTISETRIDLNWKVPTPIWLMIIVMLIWIIQIRRQNEKAQYSRSKLSAANKELKELQNNLEQLVLRRTAQLKASELKFRNLVENQGSDYFFYQHDCNGVFTYVSPSITKMLGYSTDEFMKHYRDYLTENPINQKIQEYIALSTEGIPNRPYHVEIYDNNKNPHWLEVMDSPVYDDYGICVGVDGVMHEITARKQEDERLIGLSYYDELTGLANRRLFMDRFQQNITMAQRKRLPFSLLFLDLDRFKAINDTMGHAAGDEILKEAAKRILLVLRDSDIAARFGGDEFALLLPETGKEAASLVAKKIVLALGETYSLGEEQVDLGVSIGIAAYPEDGKLSEELIKKADSAMYCAKKEQLGFICSAQIEE
jgi:diguanylate cyclase (GGDEF)-like protein/PAS domain S-box-containing protein